MDDTNGLQLILETIWAQDPLSVVFFLLILLAALAGLWVLMMMRMWMVVIIGFVLLWVL